VPPPPRFTHVDPFEDTERLLYGSRPKKTIACFTHVDPFEDTESERSAQHSAKHHIVSPTSIRSRILKVVGYDGKAHPVYVSFTHVDPFEDTESCRLFER